MRAIQITAPHTVQLVEAPEPALPSGRVLVRTLRLSLCGTDMWPYRRVAPEEEYPFPVGTPCHEVAGVVEESAADGFRPGDRVIVLPPGLGGGVEYLAARPEELVPLPPQGDLSLLVTCQPLATVLWGCQRYGSFLGKRVAVNGLGPIGLLWVACLSRLGAAEIIGIEPLAYRRRHALKQGATTVLDPASTNVTEAITEITRGALVDVVVEASGDSQAPQLAIGLARPGGTIIPFGSPHPDTVTIDYRALLFKRLVVMTSFNASSPDPAESIRDAAGLFDRGWIDLSWLVTHRLPVAEVARAFQLYDQREDGALKVVMEV